MPTTLEVLIEKQGALLEKQTAVLEKQSKVLEMALQKAVGTVQTANPLHGLGGLWAIPGLERDIITAHMRPMGIASILPIYASVDEAPQYGAITGFTASSGAEPANACEDAPTGFIKGCTLTARFGLTRRDTQTIEFDKTMLRINRGDFTDLRMRGQVLGLTNLTPSGLDQEKIFNIITMSEMVTAGVQVERKLVKEMWQGAYGTSTEFPGLDSQIATGIIDSVNGIACAALDSDIKDFNYADVEGTTPSIVEYLAMAEWYVRFNASRMGLEPMTAVIALRPELWQVLTGVWPCQYNTSKCATSLVGNNSRVFIDGRENIAERDAMRRSMTIEINGRTYPVVVDDGIHEDTNITKAQLLAGQYSSAIYFVPLTVTGGFPVTYREHVDYRASFATQNVSLLMGREDFWTDGGAYSWALSNDKWCYKLSVKTEQRVVLRTPQLAFKIQNVKYSPLQHLRSSDPSSPYWKDGGVSLRNADSFSAVWA